MGCLSSIFDDKILVFLLYDRLLERTRLITIYMSVTHTQIHLGPSTADKIHQSKYCYMLDTLNREMDSLYHRVLPVFYVPCDSGNGVIQGYLVETPVIIAVEIYSVPPPVMTYLYTQTDRRIDIYKDATIQR